MEFVSEQAGRLGSFPCDGRLTTQSGVAVSTADRTAQSTIYFTPYIGNKVALYDGTRWKLYTFTERSLSLSGLTANTNYDLFLYDNAGTLALETTAWANNSTRATALAAQDGVWCKSGALTRRYLGTIRTTGTTGQTEDSATKRFVWNAYNRTVRGMFKLESAGSWTYSTAAFRQANNNSANKVEVVVGLAVSAVDIAVQTTAFSSSTTPADVRVGEDSTASEIGNTGAAAVGGHVELSNSYMYTTARAIKVPAAGYHYYAWLEYATGGVSVTFFGGSNLGLIGFIDC